MRTLFLTLVALIIFNTSFGQFKTIQFPAEDGVMITADVYQIETINAPYILLFHQAGYSRGAYREIAPKLNAMGFNCIAIDQRSGKSVLGIENETKKSAIALQKDTQYVDAIPDLVSTLKYAKYELRAKTILVWGSSYSASLALYMGSQYPEDISGILSLSPGEYFTIEGKPIQNFAASIQCPVFITSTKTEEKNWINMYKAIPSEKYQFLPKTEGKHGSKALWEDNLEHKEYWMAVRSFLKKYQT